MRFTKIKCDRCGRDIPQSEFSEVRKKQAFKIFDLEDDELDICKDCLISFNDWMATVESPVQITLCKNRGTNVPEQPTVPPMPNRITN